MRNDLFINGADIYETCGVVMGKGFINAIENGYTLKDTIKNDSRLRDGVQTLVNTRVAERNVTLQFNIHGRTKEEYLANKKAFENILRGGLIDIRYRGCDDTYHLVYTGKSVSYNHSYNGKFGVYNAQFNEPNPAYREAERSNDVRVIRT